MNKFMDFFAHQETFEDVVKKLQSDTRNGLSSESAKRKLETEGYNEFQKKAHTSLLVKFLSQFKSFMIIVLIAAALVSGIVGYMDGEGFTDAIIILVIILLNAIIGVAQEAKAEKSLDALEKMSAPNCKVMRDGKELIIPSRELVTGDIVLLDTGDTIPADLRLIESVNMKVQEAALTGESLPVEKNTEPVSADASIGDRTNMGFSSCNVTYGRGKGIVVATGEKTEVGKIASMIQSVEETKTPLQKRLDELGKYLAIGALAICALIFVIGVLYGNDILSMFMTAVSLAAAAIPEGLPAVSTVVLAIGVQRLAERNAIVRNLPSVETLGCTSVICSDKTGTLTQNKMTVTRIFMDGAYFDPSTDPEKGRRMLLVKSAILANDAKINIEKGEQICIGDPTETALVDLGFKYNLDKKQTEEEYPRVAELPFDSERKLMSTLHKKADGLEMFIKGGLDELLDCCDRIDDKGVVRPITEEDKKSLTEANLQMAGEALRVLAMGRKEVENIPDMISHDTLEHGIIFLGMVGMIDPPREEVKMAVAECRRAGIKPVMITGDHKITATAIARSLGIMQEGDRSLTGREVQEMSDEELKANANSISVYARVAPEHKVRIVKAHQENKNVVAMTGDGVNDAPALKLADIGVAMGITGTDVSKEAADVVLTDDNFSTIVSAVSEGRRIYANIIKAIQFLLSTNIGEVLVLFIAVLFNWATPLLPIHILWINLVTDSLPALALSVDPAEKDVMEKKPIDSNQGLLTKEFSLRIALQGVLIALLTLVAYHVGLESSTEVARTMTFATLAFTQMTMIFSIRTGYHAATNGLFSNKYLWGAIIVVLIMMLTVLLIPSLQAIFKVTELSCIQWAWVTGLSFAALAISELVKFCVRMFSSKKD